MKVNDYVLITSESLLKSYKITENKTRRITKIFTDMENRLCITVEDIHSHYVNKNDLKLLTPEETLEYFKGRFEELGYELHKEEDVFIVTKKGGMFINLVILEDEINFEVETTKVKNTLIDLIREFQNWYWRDK